MINEEVVQWAAGLIAASTALVELVKRLAPQIIGGKEAHAAILVYVIGGIMLRVTGVAFETIPWVPLLMGLLVSSAAPGAFHDKVWNPLHPSPKKQAR